MRKTLLSGLLAVNLTITGCTTYRTQESIEPQQIVMNPEQERAIQIYLDKAKIEYTQDVLDELKHGPNIKKYHQLLDQLYGLDEILREEYGTNATQVIKNKARIGVDMHDSTFPGLYLINLNQLEKHMRLNSVDYYRQLQKQNTLLRQKVKRLNTTPKN